MTSTWENSVRPDGVTVLYRNGTSHHAPTPYKTFEYKFNVFARRTVIKNTDSTSNTFFGPTSTEMEQSVTNTTPIVSREVEVKFEVQPLSKFM